MARVVAAHDALQFGEFAHHVGEQIGFRQACCDVGFCDERCIPQLCRNRLGNHAHPLHTLALRTQLPVVDHFVQTWHTRFKRPFAVLIEEELRIRQARTHHFFIARNHGRRIGGANVRDDQELMRQFRLRIEQWKIFLVRLHRQNQAFLRHIEKRFLELAQHHIGPLDQRGHLVQQCLVVNCLRACGRMLGKLAHDLGAPFGKTRDHRALGLQLCFIAVGRVN